MATSGTGTKVIDVDQFLVQEGPGTAIQNRPGAFVRF